MVGIILLSLVTISTVQADGNGLDRAIHEAFQALHRMQKDDGLFQYKYNFVSQKYSNDNNMVRQAGTAYAIGEYLLYLSSQPTQKALARTAQQTLERILARFKTLSIGYKGGRLISQNRRHDKAKTGITALALVAELHYWQATKDNRFESIRKGWLKGLLALHQKEAGFAKLPGSRVESAYYN
ncbi:MAG: hypothetical protein HQL54_12435, partial [Magnetococcales bacterium]|nr:hypothetical protein [Magnetococcales bacterium]